MNSCDIKPCLVLCLLLSLVVSSCDIKPANVLLQSKQLPYRVKLADFGLGEGLLDVQGAVSIAYASICCCECFHPGIAGS